MLTMLSVKDYAAKMSCAESTIRRMCQQGILPSIKIGTGWKIDVERADEYFRLKMQPKPVCKKKSGYNAGDFLAIIAARQRELKGVVLK